MSDELPQVIVPSPEGAVGYAVSVETAVEQGWDELVADLGWTLSNLARTTDAPWVGLVEILHDAEGEPVLVQWLVGPAHLLDDAALAKAAAPLRERWVTVGIDPGRPVEPVPVLVTVGARPHHVLLDEDPPGILGRDASEPGLSLVLVEPAPGEQVAEVRFSDTQVVRPTSDHVMVVMVYVALGDMVEEGLDQEAAWSWFARFAPPQILEDLALDGEGPSAMLDATVPLLRDARDRLSDDERVMVVRLLLQAASTHGEPRPGVLDVAMAVAETLGISVERNPGAAPRREN